MPRRQAAPGRDGKSSGAAPIRPPTAARLGAVALRYLERFAASREMLRRVLQRRVSRAMQAGLIEAEAGGALIDEVLRRCAAGGLLDDRRFAVARAGSLLRRGNSPARIAADLRAKGIDSDSLAAGLAALRDEIDGDPEWHAAVTLARRRRLGPYRQAGRAEHRQRDLAILARGGFRQEIATRIIDAEDPAVLESEADR